MPEDAVQLVRAGYAAMNRVLAEGGDLRTFVREFYDPDIVMEMGPLEGTIKGYEAVARFIEGQAAVLGDLRSDPEEVLQVGDRVVVPFRLSGRARSTGLPFEGHYVHVITLRQGRTVRMKVFASLSSALRFARSHSD
jgi:ketosteroid isomerase-like protein